MSRFENNRKSHKGKIIFFAVVILALIAGFFILQKNAEQPKQREVQVDIQLPVNQTQQPATPAQPIAPQSNLEVVPENTAIDPNVVSAQVQVASVDEAAAEVLEEASIEALPPASAEAAPARVYRPTTSKIPVPQVRLPSDILSAEHVATEQATGVAEQTEGEAENTAVAAIAPTPQTQAESQEQEPVQSVASDNNPVIAASHALQIASVSIQNGVVRFRFAEDKKHIADGAKIALENVASAAKGGRYLVISPYSSADSENTKLVEQRILNIKQVLAELNAPEQQIIILKPQNLGEQNAGEHIDVFAVQTNTYPVDQVWKLQK